MLRRQFPIRKPQNVNFVCCLLLLFIWGPRPARVLGEDRGFVDRVFQDAAGEHKYVVFVPENYTAEKKWPAILFLHGAYERGSDGRRQTKVGLGPFVEVRKKTFPFLVVFPQSEDTKGRLLTGWAADSPDGKRALAILADVEKEYSIDKTREILTGWSMGGYGVWQLAAANPQRFSALVPLAGGGEDAAVKALKDLPIWAFHGVEDAVIRPAESRKMIAALRSAGGRPRYSEVPEADHNVWKVAYDSNDLYAWMLKPTLGGVSLSSLRVKPGTRPLLQAAEDEPFVPAVEIPHAVYVRLGNEALRAWAYSVPKIVPRDVLTGHIGDIYDSTVTQGRTFRVHFSQIRYRATVARAHVQAAGRDRLNVRLALKNVELTIGRTFVQGSGRSAVAGPIVITIGHRRPVWLSLVARPSVEQRSLRLKLLGTGFQIPNDNWSVSSPAGVSTRGLGMTRERVSSGLVSGLYSKKGRIQREIVSIVPTLLKKLEGELGLSEVSDLLGNIWPLPVYKPRLRVFLEEVSTDENGVSLMLGVIAAAVDPKRAPVTPRRVQSFAPSLEELPRGAHLRVGIAPALLKPLTDLLIQADVARIHVADIPGGTFAPFAHRATLAAAIPDLSRFGDKLDIWSELILADPLSVDYVGDQSVGEASEGFRFELPKVVISTAIGTEASKTTWTPYVEFEFAVSQRAQANLLKRNFRKRIFRIDWSGEPRLKVTAKFAETNAPQTPQFNTERILQMFSSSWRGWTNNGPVAEHTVPDIDFGYSKLRLSEVNWSAPLLYVGFSNPRIKVTNRSQQSFVYETKGPHSGWGDPYTLEAGQSHTFDVSYPMLCRRKLGVRLQTFTLPVGSHSEFRVPRAGGPPQLFQAREEITPESAARETGHDVGELRKGE